MDWLSNLCGKLQFRGYTDTKGEYEGQTTKIIKNVSTGISKTYHENEEGDTVIHTHWWRNRGHRVENVEPPQQVSGTPASDYYNALNDTAIGFESGGGSSDDNTDTSSAADEPSGSDDNSSSGSCEDSGPDQWSSGSSGSDDSSEDDR